MWRADACLLGMTGCQVLVYVLLALSHHIRDEEGGHFTMLKIFHAPPPSPQPSTRPTPLPTSRPSPEPSARPTPLPTPQPSPRPSMPAPRRSNIEVAKKQRSSHPSFRQAREEFARAQIRAHELQRPTPVKFDFTDQSFTAKRCATADGRCAAVPGAKLGSNSTSSSAAADSSCQDFKERYE